MVKESRKFTVESIPKPARRVVGEKQTTIGDLLSTSTYSIIPILYCFESECGRYLARFEKARKTINKIFYILTFDEIFLA